MLCAKIDGLQFINIYILPLVMEVAIGDYGDHMAWLVKAVNEGKCEKDYKSEKYGGAHSFFWHKPSDEVQPQTMLYILQNVIPFFFTWGMWYY